MEMGSDVVMPVISRNRVRFVSYSKGFESLESDGRASERLPSEGADLEATRYLAALVCRILSSIIPKASTHEV